MTNLGCSAMGVVLLFPFLAVYMRAQDCQFDVQSEQRDVLYDGTVVEGAIHVDGPVGCSLSFIRGADWFSVDIGFPVGTTQVWSWLVTLTAVPNPFNVERRSFINFLGGNQEITVIQGPNPSGTPTKHLTDQQKVHFGVITAGLTAAALAAIAVADECLSILNIPCAEYFFAEAEGLMEGAGGCANLALDPSDPNFRVIAVPNVQTFDAVQAAGQLNQANADKLNAYLTDLASVSAYSATLLVALNRTQGAIDASDTFWQTEQLNSATSLARQLASFVNGQSLLLTGTVAAFTNWRLPSVRITENQIIALQSEIAAHGLPTQILALIRRRGLDFSTTTSIMQLVTQADPNLAAGSYPSDWAKFGQWAAPTSTALLSFASAIPSIPVSADLNADGVVDCGDLSIVEMAFGTTAGQSRFDIRADLNFDGVVNIFDLAFISEHLPAGTICH
jgi:hypothetical protein